MRSERVSTWVRVLAIAPSTLALLSAALVGCADDEMGQLTPNELPDTEIVISPDVLDEAPYRIHLGWNGSDADGYVDRFQWRISDNGPDGILDSGDTIGLAWNTTVVLDSIFDVSADLDSVFFDPADSISAPEWRGWQTHTFFVRAIDERGGVDPDPAHISFTAHTIAPEIRLDFPPGPGTNKRCKMVGSSFGIGWVGSDVDDPDGVPEAVRYALVDVEDVEFEYDPLEQSRDCLWSHDGPGWVAYGDIVAAFPEGSWSEWIPYETGLDSAIDASFRGLEDDHAYIVALQARDRAGAVSPRFVWQQNYWQYQCELDYEVPPIVSVSEPLLGPTHSSQGAQTFPILPNQELRFEASAVDGESWIEAWRHGWDIADPHDPDDPGWVSDWGDATPIEHRSFDHGGHNLVVQARNALGNVGQVVVQLNVLSPRPLAERRDLLFVYDVPNSGSPSDPVLRQAFKDQWTRLLSGTLSGFAAGSDLVDAADDPQRLTLAGLLDYRSVVWFVDGRMVGTYLYSSITGADGPRYNWLQSYQQRGGNLLYAGVSAAGNSVGPWWPYPAVDPGETPMVEFNGWLSDAWCLQAVNVVLPPPESIAEPPDRRQRSRLVCDYLNIAQVDSEFLIREPSAALRIGSLRPSSERVPVETSGTPSMGLLYGLHDEEFYDFDPETQPPGFTPRACLTPMFRLGAARDQVFPPSHANAGEPIVGDPANECWPADAEFSPLTGAPVGIMSTAFSDTKPRLGSADFLWGFHPLAFQEEDVQAALKWIFEENWGLPVQP